MFGNLSTFSGELVEKNGLGISLPENEEHMTDKIYDYFQNFDREKFQKNAEDFLLKVMNEEKTYIERINAFFD